MESQVALGGLDGGVAERDLDLLERRPAEVGELGEGAPEIVRRDLAEPGPDAVGDAPQHGPGGDPGSGGPAVEGVLGPGGQRDGADAAVLAAESPRSPKCER